MDESNVMVECVRDDVFRVTWYGCPHVTLALSRDEVDALDAQAGHALGRRRRKCRWVGGVATEAGDSMLHLSAGGLHMHLGRGELEALRAEIDDARLAADRACLEVCGVGMRP